MKADVKPSSLSGRKIDQLAERRNALRAKEDEIVQELELVDAEIRACVEMQGELADRSSKTRSVAGIAWELRLTASEETKVDQKMARAFCEACGPSFASLVFRREEKLVLIQTPDRLPGGAELPISTRRIFQDAVQVKPRAPRVEVRSRLAAVAGKS